MQTRYEKQGDLVSSATLSYYDYQVLPLLALLEEAHPEVLDFADLVWSCFSSMTSRRAEYTAEKSTTSARG